MQNTTDFSKSSKGLRDMIQLSRQSDRKTSYGAKTGNKIRES